MTAAGALTPDTVRGTLASPLVPSPSWPLTLAPQHFTAPAATAQVWASPAAIDVATLSPLTLRGVLAEVFGWTPDPDAVLREMWRVAAPDGRLVVTDTDWGTLRVGATGAGDDELAAAALGWVPHPRLASTLPERLAALGARGVSRRVDRVALSAWDPDAPGEQDGPPGLPLHSIAAGAAAERERTGAVAAALRAIAQRAREGALRAELEIVTVVGRR